MKTYEITLRHDAGTITLGFRADSYADAKKAILEAEGAPESAIVTWRVVPTARQIRKTKSLMRGI
jgi:hypothetical protein